MSAQEQPRRRRRDVVLDPSYITGLGAVAVPDLRGRRKAAEEEEAELSYQRRLLQARIDVIDGELQRRHASTKGAQAVADVVAILTAEPSADVRHISPHHDPSLLTQQRRAVQRLLADPALSYVTVLSTEDLATAREQLADYEHDISSQRSAVQEVVDVLTAELMVRYRNREATIDTLLT